MRTQHQQILDFMRDYGSITKLDGFTFGCTKVDTRISELRKMGYNIQGTKEVNENTGAHYTRYRLVEQ